MSIVDVFRKRKDDSKQFLKSNLFIFCRVLTSQEEYDSYKNPYKYIKNDKNYCFIGQLTDNNTKIINVLNGQIYDNLKYQSSVYHPFKVKNGTDIFENARLFYVNIGDFKTTCVRIMNSYGLSNNTPVFRAESQVYKYYFLNKDSTCTKKTLKMLVKEINEKTHKRYQIKCKEYEQSKQQVM